VLKTEHIGLSGMPALQQSTEQQVTDKNKALQINEFEQKVIVDFFNTGHNMRT